MTTQRWPTPCEAMVDSGRRSQHDGRMLTRRCRKPVRFVFTGTVEHRQGAYTRRLALCAAHSGPGLLSEGALPGWVESVEDLRS